MIQNIRDRIITKINWGRSWYVWSCCIMTILKSNSTKLINIFVGGNKEKHKYYLTANILDLEEDIDLNRNVDAKVDDFNTNAFVCSIQNIIITSKIFNIFT